MGKIILPIGTREESCQDLWEVIHGNGTLCYAIRIGFVGLNTMHPVGVGEPEQ